MKLLHTLAVGLGLALAYAGPALAVGQPPAENGLFNYHTELVPQYHGAGAFAGRLHLTISKDGIVGGFYQPEDGGQIKTVTGGVRGNQIWLDLGTFGAHIDGKLESGKIVGYTYRDQLYKFTAVPSDGSA